MVTRFSLYPALQKGITVPLQNKAPSVENRKTEQHILPLSNSNDIAIQDGCA